MCRSAHFLAEIGSVQATLATSSAGTRNNRPPCCKHIYIWPPYKDASFTVAIWSENQFKGYNIISSCMHGNKEAPHMHREHTARRMGGIGREGQHTGSAWWWDPPGIQASSDSNLASNTRSCVSMHHFCLAQSVHLYPSVPGSNLAVSWLTWAFCAWRDC